MQVRRTKRLLAYTRVLPFLLLLMSSSFVHAHPLSPSLWKLTEGADGHVSMIWRTPAAKVPGVEFYPALPRGCRQESVASPVREGSYWIERFELRCGLAWRDQTLAVEGLAQSRSNVILAVSLADDRHFQQVLNADVPSFRIPERIETGAVLKGYLALGFEHILAGWDHLLFVLGLFLLVGFGRKLFWTVTSFTLGHSITLSLAALEIFLLPSRLVEVLIAVTILLLALELLGDGSRFFHRNYWLMAFSFGLLHGLGFAGALSEIGLPQGEIPLALLSFNLGIEAGQLAFIAALSLLVHAAAKVPFPQVLRRVEIPAYVIGSLAVYWIFERITDTTVL